MQSHFSIQLQPQNRTVGLIPVGITETLLLFTKSPSTSAANRGSPAWLRRTQAALPLCTSSDPTFSWDHYVPVENNLDFSYLGEARRHFKGRPGPPVHIPKCKLQEFYRHHSMAATHIWLLHWIQFRFHFRSPPKSEWGPEIQVIPWRSEIKEQALHKINSFGGMRGRLVLIWHKQL